MLKKIDQYIIKKYLGAFLFTLLIFSMIAIIFSVSERVQKFIEHDLSASQIIFDYYLNFIPWINSILFPIYALISVIFITSRMANNSEIISIFGAGVSFWRLLRPYLLAAFLICGVHLFANHIMLPNGNKTMMDFENKYIFPNNVKNKNRNVHIFIGPEAKVYVRYFRSRDTTAVDFRIEQFRGSELVSLVKAKSIKWIGEPNNWRLKNYEIRTFDGENEDLVLGKGETLDTSLNFTPKDFVYYSNQKGMMTTAELNEFIAIQEAKAAGGTRVYEVEKYRRTADPFTVIILTVIGVAVAGRKVRGGMGLHLATGIVIGAVFIFLSKVSITFTTNHSFPPMIGVWIPNIIFGIIALYLTTRAQK